MEQLSMNFWGLVIVITCRSDSQHWRLRVRVRCSNLVSRGRSTTWTVLPPSTRS